ncbi:MAG: trypsin-like peptidase domain-containing protein [Solirubrobacteraceae bacterium]
MLKLASHFLAALLGGIVVAAVVLLAGDRDDGDGEVTTVVQQAGVALANPEKGALSPRTIYTRDAPGVVFVRARISENGQTGVASGSGFVIGRGGSIVTNAHVVGDAKQVTVKFSDSRIATAKVAGADPSTDLALLLVDPDGLDLHALKLGSSKNVAVGDPALAIGNPFGLERTLTTGVISAVAREIPSLQEGFKIGNVLQTDAAINPGNSGGPLLDAQGRIIGVNAQIATGATGGNLGIGFAVPVDTLKEVIPRLRREGAIERAYLGVGTRTVDGSLAALDLPVSDGALVQNVESGSPAARAGIRAGRRRTDIGGEPVLLGGDILRAIDGKRARTSADVARLIGAKRPGDSVMISLLRGDDERTVTVELVKRPGAGSG